MTITLVLVVAMAVLFACGVYLLLERSLTPDAARVPAPRERAQPAAARHVRRRGRPAIGEVRRAASPTRSPRPSPSPRS